MGEAGGMPPRHSALGDLLAPYRLGAEAGRAEVSLSERCGPTIWQLAAWRTTEVAPLRASLAERLGLTLAEAPTACGAEEVVIFQVAPRRWWLVGARGPGGDLRAGLAEAVTGRAALIDLSHARTVIRLSGPASRQVLQKLCRIDLEPPALSAGHVAQTALGQVAALIHALDEEAGFDLYLPRSLVRSAAESLIDAATEFGLEAGD